MYVCCAPAMEYVIEAFIGCASGSRINRISCLYAWTIFFYLTKFIIDENKLRTIQTRPKKNCLTWLVRTAICSSELK